MFGPKKLGSVSISISRARGPTVGFNWEGSHQPTDSELIDVTLLYFGRLITNLTRSLEADKLISFAGYARTVYEKPDEISSFLPRRNPGLEGDTRLTLVSKGSMPGILVSFSGGDPAAVGVECFHVLVDYLYENLPLNLRLAMFASLGLIARYYREGGRRGVGSELQAYAFVLEQFSLAQAKASQVVPE